MARLAVLEPKCRGSIQRVVEAVISWTVEAVGWKTGMVLGPL
jgi:hypothetical protein